MNNTHFIENSYLKLGIDNYGSITCLYNKKTGTQFIKKDSGSGWKLIVSLRGWTEYPVFDYMNPGEIRKNKNKISVSFKHLTGLEGDFLSISMDLYFRLRGEDVILEAGIKNNSPEVVREVWFPLISGLTKISSSEKDSFITIPLWIGSKFRNPVKTLPENWVPKEGSFSWKFPLLYPGIASMSWIDFYNEKEGLYFASYDKTFQTTGLGARRRKEKGDFQLGIIKYPFIEPGETWKSKEYIISAHRGDWHAGAKKYRRFTDTWMEKIKRPDWIKQAPGLCDLFMKHQNKRIYFNYDRLPLIQKENLKKGLNLPLYIFSWYGNGHDSGYPEYAADKDMGGEGKLKEAIRDVKEKKGKAILYTQGRLIDFATNYYKNKGHKVCIKNEDGIFYIDEYSWPIQGSISPHKVFAIACPSTKEWSRQLNKQVDLVMSLGADGLLFDQIGGDHPYLCFDKTHPHKKPAMAFAGKIKLLKNLRKRTKRKNKNFAIMVELVCDCFLQYVDMVHAHCENFRPEGNLLPMPELYRYTFPEHILSSRDAYEEEAINQSFVLGLRQEYWRMFEAFEHVDARFENDPEQLRVKNYVTKMLKSKAHLEKIFKLKKKCPELLIEGIFKDEEGIRVSDKKVEAKLFTSKHEEHKAVVLWNKALMRKNIKLEVSRKDHRYKVLYPDKEINRKTINLKQSLSLSLGAGEICAVIIR